MKLNQYLKLYNTSQDEFKQTFIEVMNVTTEEDYLLKLDAYNKLKPNEIKKDYIQLNKRKFYFEKDFETLQFEKWLYFNDFVSDDEKQTINNLSAILTLFLYEKNIWGKRIKFDKNKIDELAELFEKEMEIEDALYFIGFFLNLEKILLHNMSHQYSQIVEAWVEQQIQSL